MLKTINKCNKLERRNPLILQAPYIHATISLPAEILGIIFGMIVDSHQSRHRIDCARNDSWREQREAAATMRSVSQVDGLWRYTALGCKYIWGMLLDIDSNSDEWVEELVSRSKPAPLVVQSVYCPGDDHRRFLSPKWTLLLDEAYRFSVLHVVFDGVDHITPILHGLLQPMPLLEYLHIESDEHLLEHGQQLHHMLPGDLLVRSAPNLRSLVLSRTIMSLSVDLSPFELVHLDITIGEDDGAHLQIPVDYFLDLLAGQPLLETFQLNSRALPTSLLPGTVQPREVPLPRLAVLKIRGYNHDADDLFGNLILEPTCDVQLHFCSMSSWTRIDGLARGMVRFFRNWTPDPEQYLFWSIKMTTPGDFSISLELRQTESDEIRSSRFSLRYEMDEHLCPLSDHLIDILQCLQETPFAGSNTVFLLGLTGTDWKVFRDLHNFQNRLVSFFSSFKTVQKLFLDETYIDTTVESVLKERLDNSGSIIFPNLQSLILRVQDNSGTEGLSTETFLNYVCWRCEMGRPIPNVSAQYY